MRLIIFLIVLSFSTAGYTQEDSNFKDWISLTKLLRSEGIEPTRIKWEKIDPACLGLKNSDSQIAYNKCKYEKAKNSVLYKADSSQCSTLSREEYPEQLLKGSKDTLQKTDKDGNITKYEHSSEPVTNSQLKELRQGAVIRCMQGRGWVDVNNWLMGKTN